MAAQRAEARAGRIQKHRVEGTSGHKIIRFQHVADKRLGHVDAEALHALLEHLLLEGAVVERDVLLDLEAPSAKRAALDEDRLRGAARAHLQKRRRLLLGEHACRHLLRRRV